MKGKYCYSYDGETYDGEFDTIEAVKHELGGDIENVHLGVYGEALPIQVGTDEIVDFIEEYENDNAEIQLDEGFFYYVKPAALDDLRIEIEAALEKFRNNAKPKIHHVTDVEWPVELTAPNSGDSNLTKKEM